MAVLEVKGLAKRYGDAIALRDAALSLEAGEVHGLVGENGAGKSTLVKALSGMLTPNAGNVTVGGEDMKLGVLAASRNAGIRTAFQELSLLPSLTVAENLMFSELPTRGGVVPRKLVEARAAEILARWDVHDIDPGALASQLPLSAQQRLEIVRALNPEPRILILDEPTASLPQTDWLFGQVLAAKARGAAILYISHKLAEIEELCDRGSIMRNGQIVGGFTRDSFDHDSLISQMIGRSIEVAFPPVLGTLDATAAPLLEVVDAVVEQRLRGVSLNVRPGEIVGVAGLEGQGQKELFYAIAGAGDLSAGSITVDGQAAKFSSPRDALRCGPGIALVPEERKREGIFADMTSVKNMSVPVLGKLSRFGLINSRAEHATARTAGLEHYLREDYLTKDVGPLSGGNQQKTIIARTTLTGARILLMFDPTRGIDPAAKLEVYRTLRRAAADGAGILLYSTEIPELIGMSDRIVVLYGGKVAAELAGTDMQESTIMAAAVGRARPSTAPLEPIGSTPSEVAL
ncbi:ribose transport system ATP-binding protein [Arthrobacter sp. 1088]|uniref:sugar ABC transporter ATP-binding protein n=1 Tax=Arthrobacter sp. 1088 TaxID=2817768 RepID=UPI0028560DA6|nr:sugar ABC transporter ATP-binding protein [Arthrobacter sp. 1088]MDR6688678.1 ribose transport system ATP-binding protein [Arthrobacter sp. 1088]